jgi:hypothetical protein
MSEVETFENTTRDVAEFLAGALQSFDADVKNTFLQEEFADQYVFPDNQERVMLEMTDGKKFFLAIQDEKDAGTAFRSLPATYVVVALGYWGRGKTILEAAKACNASGAIKTDEVNVKVVYAPAEPPYVDGDGGLHYKSAYQLVDVLRGIKLGNLINTKEP